MQERLDVGVETMFYDITVETCMGCYDYGFIYQKDDWANVSLKKLWPSNKGGRSNRLFEEYLELHAFLFP